MYTELKYTKVYTLHFKCVSRCFYSEIKDAFAVYALFFVYIMTYIFYMAS